MNAQVKDDAAAADGLEGRIGLSQHGRNGQHCDHRGVWPRAATVAADDATRDTPQPRDVNCYRDPYAARKERDASRGREKLLGRGEYPATAAMRTRDTSPLSNRHHALLKIQYMLPINNTGTSTVCIFNARVQG